MVVTRGFLEVELNFRRLIWRADNTPSDSLIDGARAVLGSNSKFSFPCWEITCPADTGGEDQTAITM